MTVAAAWPGATAAEMETQVADRMEKRLQELRYFDKVETLARPGLVFLTLQLRDDIPPGRGGGGVLPGPQEAVGRGVCAAAGGARARSSTTNIRTFTSRSTLFRRRAWLTATRGRRRLSGSACSAFPASIKVNILGEQTQRIYVEFSYGRLATLGVNALQIFEALRKQNAVTPAGSVETRGPRVFVRLDGSFADVEAIRNVPIAAGCGRFAWRCRRCPPRLRGSAKLHDPPRRPAGPYARRDHEGAS
jgi:hypothetical protein